MPWAQPAASLLPACCALVGTGRPKRDWLLAVLSWAFVPPPTLISEAGGIWEEQSLRQVPGDAGQCVGSRRHS